MIVDKQLDERLLLNYGVRPRFIATRDITRGDIWSICNALGNHVDLERRSEGGLLFYDGEDGYNSIRFRMDFKFPIMRVNEKALWKNDNLNIVLNKAMVLGTIFKTFIYKTHVDVKCKPWTLETIQEVYDAFESNGLKRIKKYDPKVRDFDKIPNSIFFKMK